MISTHININPELLIKLVASKLGMWAEDVLSPLEKSSASALGGKHLMTNGMEWHPISLARAAQWGVGYQVWFNLLCSEKVDENWMLEQPVNNKGCSSSIKHPVSPEGVLSTVSIKNFY